MKQKAISAAASFFLALAPCTIVHAEPPDALQQASNVISQTADHLCGFVEKVGTEQHAKIEGEISSQISELMKRLFSFGFKLGGQYDTEHYVGFLRKDLIEAYKTETGCKIAVLAHLKEILLAPRPNEEKKTQCTFHVLCPEAEPYCSYIDSDDMDYKAKVYEGRCLLLALNRGLSFVKYEIIGAAPGCLMQKIYPGSVVCPTSP